jgi:hypothetical protein
MMIYNKDSDALFASPSTIRVTIANRRLTDRPHISTPLTLSTGPEFAILAGE